MKRLLLLLLALVPGLVLFAWLGSRGDGAVSRWQRLPSGGEVRVRGITFGTVHAMENDGRSLLQRARDWWKGPRPKGGPSPFARRNAEITDEHSLRLWVEQRRMPGNELRFPYATLHLPEGDTFPDTKKSTWPNPDGHVLTALRFPLVPYREKTLRFTVGIGGEEVAFEVPNPAARRPIPMWTPQPLPQTARQGDLELTLRSLPVKPLTAGSGDPWAALPAWDMTDAGRPAMQWYDIEFNFEDAGGNSSWICGLLAEPVWRVRTLARRTRDYPFTAEHIHWLGTIDPAAIGADAALALDDAARLRGVRFVGVLPAGRYLIDASGVVKTISDLWYAEPPRGAAARPSHQPDTTVILPESLAVVATEYPKPFLYWRQPDGSIRPATTWVTNGSHPCIQTVALPREPTSIGIAEEKELTFEFYVAAPERPKGVPSPPPR